MQKILYFTAGMVPTSAELLEIADLNARAEVYEVLVRNGSASTVGDDYGPDRLEPCDLVAGTVPTAYSAVDVVPDFSLQATVTHNEEIAITGGTVTLTVVDGEITGGAFVADP